MMNEFLFGGSIRMKSEVENVNSHPHTDDEGYPYRLPEVYIEGWIDPYESLDLGEDSIIVVRDKHILRYTKLEHAELLAETETGETIWVDSRWDCREDNFKGRILDDIRSVCEYMVEEYDIKTSQKRKYKVVLDEESQMNSLDYYLLSHSVDGETLGEHLDIIDGVLFQCFSKEENIVIPEGVTDIEGDAFELCKHLKSIVIPSTVTKIPCGFCRIDRIEVAKDNPKYYVQDGCLIDKEEKELVWAFAGSTIPDDGSVVKIGSDAFRHRYDLSKIVIPDVITGIGDDAFIGCGYVEEIILPEHFVEDSQRIFGRMLIKDGDKWIFEARNFSGFSF